MTSEITPATMGITDSDLDEHLDLAVQSFGTHAPASALPPGSIKTQEATKAQSQIATPNLVMTNPTTYHSPSATRQTSWNQDTHTVTHDIKGVTRDVAGDVVIDAGGEESQQQTCQYLQNEKGQASETLAETESAYTHHTHKRRRVDNSEGTSLHSSTIYANRRDIGRVIGVGGLGEVLAYRGLKPRALIKCYVHEDSFNNELRAYLDITSSGLPIPIPHFYGPAILPTAYRSFRHSSGLIIERMDGPSLREVLHRLETPRRESLRQEIQTSLASLHTLGISHGDITENNIMFRAPEQTDWVFIDFGESWFRSELSEADWRKVCVEDKAYLAGVFKAADAQYAIDSGLQFLESYVVNDPPIDVKAQVESFEHLDAISPLSAADLLRSYANPSKSTTLRLDEKTIQNHLACLLKIAIYLPHEAITLVDMISDRFAPLAPQLANSMVDLCFHTGSHVFAYRLLDRQLSNPSLPLAIQTYFHFQNSAISYYHGPHKYSMPTLQSAIPVFIDQYGDHDWRTLSAKYKLLLLYIDDKDIPRATDLYEDVGHLNGEKDTDLGAGTKTARKLVQKWHDKLMKSTGHQRLACETPFGSMGWFDSLADATTLHHARRLRQADLVI